MKILLDEDEYNRLVSINEIERYQEQLNEINRQLFIKDQTLADLRSRLIQLKIEVGVKDQTLADLHSRLIQLKEVGVITDEQYRSIYIADE